MEAIVKGPDEGPQDLNLMEWPSQELDNNASTPTYLYIAVEYIKGEPTAILPEPYNDFDQHVSPLDPNMNMARYSPLYNTNEPSTDLNPVVIHQLVQPETTNQFNNLETLPVLCNNIDNQYLSETNSVIPSTSQQVENNEQVELLITDQNTGISYSVRGSQEFLVERCLDDEQLLNALTAQDPLLTDTDLLALDVNSLKTELNEDIINSSEVPAVDAATVSNYISSLSNDDKNLNKLEKFKHNIKQTELEFDEQLFSKVYSIIDKPIVSMARATLPERFLEINKINEEFGVFAKKPLAQRTQFGPMAGILMEHNYFDNDNKLKYLIVGDDSFVRKLDVSDESTSNWMSFVRRAVTYKEQNLIISQIGNALYFTTTKTIQPKQELKVGYSLSYANRHKLEMLKPDEDEADWPCFECEAKFKKSDELQNHLNVHEKDREDDKKDKKLPKKKKHFANGNNSKLSEILKCNECEQLFSHPVKLLLEQHMAENHPSLEITESIDDFFSVVKTFTCEHCDITFNSEALLTIHYCIHGFDEYYEQKNHICPSCQRKFPTQRQLVTHISIHSLKLKTKKDDGFKCVICHKIFAFKERLRRHMLVHGSDDAKPLECKQCNKRFLNNSALAGHLKTHFVGKKIFECPICKERFDHVLKLKTHVPNHCENNLYSCPHCTKVFKKYSVIRKHIRAFHCEQKHECSQCSKLFPTLDKLRMHLLRHSDHREFLCADCGKQFKRKDKLKEHCKRLHSEERENDVPKLKVPSTRKLGPKTEPTDFHRFIYKCHTCLVGFKRRGMLVNHLAKRHPDIPPDSVPELNLPILQTTRDYYCQHCDKVYKSSSKRKAHILKNHPGAALPMSNRKQGGYSETNLPNPTFSQTVGSITTSPQSCKWCHKQYASKAKLLQHQRKKHMEQLEQQNEIKSENNSGDNINSQNDEKPNWTNIEPIQTLDNIVVPDHCLQNYKISEANILNDFDKKVSQYCNLNSLDNDDENFLQSQPQNDPLAPNSNVYRLLTTSNGLVPPR